MDRSLHLLQILEMKALVKEIAQPLDQPSVHFVEVVLGDGIPDFGENSAGIGRGINPLQVTSSTSPVSGRPLLSCTCFTALRVP